jgi:hypothetical protein
MDFADLVGLAGVVKDTLGRGGLAGVDMGHDAEIAIAFERMAAGHDASPLPAHRRLGIRLGFARGP